MIFKFLFILTLYRACSAALPSQSSCGVPAISSNIIGSTLNRIINGEYATANSWPWQVSLRKIKNGYVSSHLCGGTLIYEDIVLTAAHCVDTLYYNEIAVVVGLNDFSTERLTTSNTLTLSARYFHRSYASQPEIINDIAILKLSKSVVLGTKIALACLPSASDINTIITKNTVVTGWGSTTGGNSASALAVRLKQAKLLVNNERGRCRYGFTSSTYCAYDNEGTSSNSCFGDSGGPLIYYADSKWYVFGIVSFVLVNSNGDCDNINPSYYTRVPAYLTWLETALNETAIQAQRNFAHKQTNSLALFNFSLLYSVVFVLLKQ